MKIRSIKIKGWRSFNDEDGIELRGLKKINLIIGPNNSGKSNVLRFFHTLKEMCSYRLGHQQSPEGVLSCSVPSENPGDSKRLTKDDFWNHEEATFSGTILFEEVPNPLQYRSQKFTQIGALKGVAQIEVNCKPRSFRDLNGEIVWESSLMPGIPFSYEALWQMIVQGGLPTESITPWIAASGSDSKFQIDGDEYRKALALFSATYPKSPTYTPLIKIEGQEARFLAGYSPTSPFSLQYVVQPSNAPTPFGSLVKPIIGTFLDSIYCISPVRDHNRAASTLNIGEDGSDIIERCKKLKNSKSETNEWGDFKDKIEHWMRTILGEPMMDIDFDDEDLRFRMQRGGRKKYQYFHQLGTGVSQLFMLFAYLLFNKDRTLHAFLDEPENSLHPQAVAQLVRTFMEPEFAKHRFFICTHAPSLMDMVDENWSVHKVSMSAEKFTIVQPCTDIISKFRLLDEMGIRASQILQSNFVIWVEGPSDRVYIRAWIKAWSENSLLEGKHFSFAFYGGSVLKYYGFEDPTEADVVECISLFSTSRFAMVVIDSDKKTATDNDRPIIAKLQSALEASPDKKDYISIWQTAGREIENYVPAELWEKLVEDHQVWKKRTKVNDAWVKLQIEKPVQRIILGKYDNFAEYLCSYYLVEGSAVSATSIPELPKFHDGQKVRISSILAKDWSISLVMYDLDEKMNNLVSKIRIANRI